jgi:hypothetical protein
MKSVLLTLLVCIVFPFCGTLGQTISESVSTNGEIRGVALDAVTGQPLPGASVMIVNRFGGAQADRSGAFVLTRLAPGTYSLHVSHVGYETRLVENIVVAPTDTAVVTVELAKRLTSIKDITVTPSQFTIMGTEPAAQQNLTRREIETMPQLGDDFFRAVNRLPGMASSDFCARFIVRGGEYEEVLVNLDGLQIHEPFHMKDIDGGAMSVIDVAAVDGIDLMTGGFPARYGDKMSGVFNIRSKRVPSDSKRLSLGLSLLNTRVASEGTFADNKGSWLVSFRRGYIDWVLKLVEPDETLKPTYYDLYAKTQYQVSHNHVLSVNVLHASDDLRYFGEDEDEGDTLVSSYGNTYCWLALNSLVHPRVTAQTILSTGTINQKRRGQMFNLWLQSPDAIVTNERTFDFFGLKSDWECEVSDRYLVTTGIDFRTLEATYDHLSRQFHYRYEVTPESTHVTIDGIDTTGARMDRSGSKLAAYLSNRVRPFRQFTAEFGIRYDRASYSGDDIISPRLNMVFTLGERTTVRGGWGYFYQTQGIDGLYVGDGESSFSPAQRAEHWVAGLEHEFESGIKLRLEAYFKNYSRLRPSFRNSFNTISLFPEADYDRTIVHREKTVAKGIELFLKRDLGGTFSWWASYAYAKVEDSVRSIYFPSEDVETAYNKKLPAEHDQRHTLYFDLSYRPSRNWQINMAWQYHTGWPYTDVHLVRQPSGSGYVYYIQSDEQWGARFEDYSRIDLRLNRYFNIAKGRLSVFVEVLNVLDRENVRGYDNSIQQSPQGYYLEKEPETWFGRLPSAGITYELVF